MGHKLFFAPEEDFERKAYAICSRPDNFAVIDQDNGYQKDGRQKWLARPTYWKARLLAAWDSVASELEKRGVTLIRIPSDPDLPDQCFTADPAVVAMKQYGADLYGTIYALASHMNSPIRQREVDRLIDALEDIEFATGVDGVTACEHEGTGDLLYLPGHDFYVQGIGTRSKAGIGCILSAMLNQLVVEVPLRLEDASSGPNDNAAQLATKDTKGFHLDTLVFPLPGKHIVACFERMHPATRAFFENLYPENKRISLTPREADLFIANGLVVKAIPQDKSLNGRTLFMPKRTPKHIRDRLKTWGFGFKGFDVEPSKLAGGGWHCMFNFVFEVNLKAAKAVAYYFTPEGKNIDRWPENLPPLPPDVRNNINFYSPSHKNITLPALAA